MSYSGVTWSKDTGRWRARLRTKDGVTLSLGSFQTQEEAIEAVESARRALEKPPAERPKDEQRWTTIIPLSHQSFHGIPSRVGPLTGEIPPSARRNPGIVGRDRGGAHERGKPWAAVVDLEDVPRTMQVRGFFSLRSARKGRRLGSRSRGLRGAWFVRWSRAAGSPMAYGDYRGTGVTLHRLIMGLEPGEPREAIAKDGDYLNCRRSNLIIVRSADVADIRNEILYETQAKYRRRYELATEHTILRRDRCPKGVTYRRRDGKYIARFGARDEHGVYRTYYVGIYDSLEAAIQAREARMSGGEDIGR